MPDGNLPIFMGDVSTETWTDASPRHSNPVMIMAPITRSVNRLMISSFPMPFWRLTTSRPLIAPANWRQTASVSVDFAAMM